MKNLTKKLLTVDGQTFTMELLPESIISENVKKYYGKYDLKRLQGELILRQSAILELCRGLSQVVVIDAALLLNTMYQVLDDISSNADSEYYIYSATSKHIDHVFKDHFYNTDLGKVLYTSQAIVPVLNKCIEDCDMETLLPAAIETFIEIESFIKSMYFDLIHSSELVDGPEYKTA